MGYAIVGFCLSICKLDYSELWMKLLEILGMVSSAFRKLIFG